jgi:hypothetical protein
MWFSIEERYFTLSVGILFMLIGIAGFVPSLVLLPTAEPFVPPNLTFDQGYGYVVGLFPTNLLYNSLHLIFGVLGIALYSSFSCSRVFNRGLTIFYTWIAIMGLLPFTSTMFGLMPLFGNNVWFNALIAAIAAYYGFVKPLLDTPVL